MLTSVQHTATYIATLASERQRTADPYCLLAIVEEQVDAIIVDASTFNALLHDETTAATTAQLTQGYKHPCCIAGGGAGGELWSASFMDKDCASPGSHNMTKMALAACFVFGGMTLCPVPHTIGG